MPYDSDAQRRLFHSSGSPVSKEKVAEFDQASKGMKLPNKVQHKARGGAIEPMRVEKPAEALRPESPYKVLKEEATHFVVAHDSDPAKAFRVAKHGLGHKTLNRIREHLQPVQHLADGGEAQPTYLGDQGDATNPADFTTGGVQVSKPPVFASVDQALQPGEKPVGMDPAPDGQGFVTQATSGDPKNAAGGQDWYGPNSPSLLEKQYDALGQGEQPKPNQPAKTPGAPGYNGFPELNRRQKEFEQGSKDWASAMDSLGKDQFSAQKSGIDQRNAIAQKAEVERQAMTKKIDDTVTEIKNFKLDPDRHWGTGGTAVIRKTMAGIGMILSGAGSGYTGQPNMAMQVIEKAIDRDIDAQKTDLANKNNLLSIYFKQYGNINDAETRAKMDLTANVQAQLDMALAKAKGPLAQAEIQKAMAENGMKLVQMRDSLVTSQAQRSNMAVDAQLKQFQLQLEQRKLDLFNGLMGHGGQGGSIDPGTYQKMRTIDPKMGDNWARGPDGNFYQTTNGEKSTAEIYKASQAEMPFRQLVQGAKEKMAKIGYLQRFDPRSPELASLEQDLNNITMEIPRQMNDVNRFTGEERKMADDFHEAWKLRPGYAIAGMDALLKQSNNRLASVYKNHFISDAPVKMLTQDIHTRGPNDK